VLARYGGAGAYGCDRMISNRLRTEELRQLATIATFLPAFFLMIAALLVNIALGRVIATEPSNIRVLKAFGYSNAAVAWRYAKSAFLFALVGAVLGTVAGVALGRRAGRRRARAPTPQRRSRLKNMLNGTVRMVARRQDSSGHI
jgi:putative ABC transport system permease protein